MYLMYNFLHTAAILDCHNFRRKLQTLAIIKVKHQPLGHCLVCLGHLQHKPFLRTSCFFQKFQSSALLLFGANRWTSSSLNAILHACSSSVIMPTLEVLKQTLAVTYWIMVLCGNFWWFLPIISTKHETVTTGPTYCINVQCSNVWDFM